MVVQRDESSVEWMAGQWDVQWVGQLVGLKVASKAGQLVEQSVAAMADQLVAL